MRCPTTWLPTATAVPVDIKARAIRKIYLPSEARLPRINHVPRTISTPQFFEDYIQALPLWERELLTHVDWHGNHPFQIMRQLTTGKSDQRLYVVSDGSSVTDKTMSFGVVVGTAENTALISLQGPAYGIPSSHRAECTGCLAGALILAYQRKHRI